MSDFSLTLVLQIKTSKIINDMAKIQKIIEKNKHFPDYFLTKAPPINEETEAAMTSVSLFSSLGNIHHTQVPVPSMTGALLNVDNFLSAIAYVYSNALII